MSAPRWVLLLSQAQRPTTYSKRKKEANANQDTAPLATCFANKNASACLHAQTKPKPRSHAQRLVPHAPCTTIRRSTKPGASRTRCHHQAASQQNYSSTLLDTEHMGSSTLMLCSSHACSQWAVVNGIRCANNAENLQCEDHSPTLRTRHAAGHWDGTPRQIWSQHPAPNQTRNLESKAPRHTLIGGHLSPQP